MTLNRILRWHGSELVARTVKIEHSNGGLLELVSDGFVIDYPGLFKTLA